MMDSDFLVKFARMLGPVMAAIPGDSRDTRGNHGTIDCPLCERGRITWARAKSNGHLHASPCSSPTCEWKGMMQ